MSNINKQLQKIVNLLYKKYGPNTSFKEYDFKLNEQGNNIFYFRSQTGNNIEYFYEIQIFQLGLKKKITLSNCKYCNKKNCSYKLKCCGSATHFNCYKQKYNL